MHHKSYMWGKTRLKPRYTSIVTWIITIIISLFYNDRLIDTIDHFTELIPLEKDGRATLKTERLTVHSAQMNATNNGYSFDEGKCINLCTKQKYNSIVWNG